MSFRLKYKNIDERRETNEKYTIKDLMGELGLSSQTTVAKKNGELAIEDTIIEDGDEINLIQIIYGG